MTYDPNARGGKRRYLDSEYPEDFIPDFENLNLDQATLTYLADLFGTDKGTIKHNYTYHYERLIRNLVKNQNRLDATLLIGELGVACGASLRTWSSYLPKSKIIGYDIRPECAKLCKDLKNVSIIIGDSNSPATFQGKNAFDLFIDDGSHIVEDIVKTFTIVWPKIKPDGYYVIEDIKCTYNPSYTKQFSIQFGKTVKNDRNDFIGFVDYLMRNVDSKGLGVESLEYYPQLLIIKKSVSY